MIGIFGIFIGDYITYLPNFIEQVESNFLPTKRKHYFIVSDQEQTIQLDSVEWLQVQKIGWPYETLYRFVYFLQFKSVKKCSFIFFLNSNIQIQQRLSEKELLPPQPFKHTFVLHRCQSKVQDSTKSNSMETFQKSTCYIEPCQDLHYIIGGLFGAYTPQFINLCTILSEHVFQNELQRHIAIWHDETHLNYYVHSILRNQVLFLNRDEYHGYGCHPDNKVDFKKKPLEWTSRRQAKFGTIHRNSYFEKWKQKNQTTT